jgi:polysaccharide biosynthesis/export protein
MKVLAFVALAIAAAASQAQQPAPATTTESARTNTVPPAPLAAPAPAPAATVAPAAGVALPSNYTIGPDDILSIVFWRDKDMSADVVVRPDGRITLPLISDVQAGGLTPEALRDRIREQATKFVEDPSVTVVVKQINSRRVFVTGMVSKPGAYPLSNPTTVLQLLSMAGGVNEFADAKKIIVMRTENGLQKAYPFNYKDVSRGKSLKQNIQLQPGDTVVVP